MKIQYDPDFLRLLKKVNIRIRKSLRQKIEIFLKNPDEPSLNNHALRDKYEGYKSIDITADWRAIYEEFGENGELIAYFVDLGTHKELYG
ncbi:MAG TPA: type II toxin-antitoxin system mRNA interferase toxin, RelE/StbE family [Xanthomonadales bacterium]|nr:type II toxin-antitoxin system mRNA interferase toxin, RelE/StbE family [Xanthomonadales bacterium]